MVKNGERVEIKMDKSEHKVIENQIQNNLKKDQCFDIFQNIVVNKKMELLKP
jgi:hypothetical protein